MKIRQGYILRQVIDVYAVIGIGGENYSPYEIMSVNETGAYLWKLLEKGADRDELAEALLSEYDVDRPTAEKDVDAFLARLGEKGLLEE